MLSEGADARVVAAALAANSTGLARVSVVGATQAVGELLADMGRAGDQPLEIHDPATSPLTATLSEHLLALRADRGMTPERAAREAQEPLKFAALMVRAGYADGTVGGAVATTSETVRAALQIIGRASAAPLVSSFFLMILPPEHPSGRQAMIFSDCGLVIEPNVEELAAIAGQSAASYRALTDEDPQVAFLSFSTQGSARHGSVTKICDALERFRAQYPTIFAEGELQFDAAFVPEVAQTKAPGSRVAGHANVMIFPDLNAGNIGYKIAQRVGGCLAVGPVLQGLAQPANDLSRGCTVEDILHMIAITALQVTNHD